MIIQLVRHMETDMNKSGTFQGSLDIELNQKGKQDCNTFVQQFDGSTVDKIYCSTLQRATYLANLLGKSLQKEVHYDERLNEIFLGEWQGMTWPEVTVQYKDFLTEWFKDHATLPVPGGESYKQVQDRAMSVIKEIAEEDVDHVVVVAHGALIKTVIAYILGLDLRNRSTFNIDNGSVTTIQVSKGKFKLLHINQPII